MGEQGMLPTEWARLVRLCAQFMHDRQTAEDLVQETMIVAWQSALAAL